MNVRAHLLIPPHFLGSTAFKKMRWKDESGKWFPKLSKIYDHVCCVCVVIPFTLKVRLVDAPAGVTQEEGRTGFLHLPSAVLALIFIARRIQPSLSLVDRDIEFCVPTN